MNCTFLICDNNICELNVQNNRFKQFQKVVLLIISVWRSNNLSADLLENCHKYSLNQGRHNINREMEEDTYTDC